MVRKKKGIRHESMGKEQEHFKIYARVFDEYTLNTLKILASKRFFQTLDYPISTGKEADVYRVTTREKTYFAAKIYRIETSNFKAMQKYLLGDPRFKRVKGKRKIVETWCQKEFRNLREAYDIGIRVPYPVKALKNVLILEFIGENGVAAPLLKDVKIKNPKKLVKALADDVEKMWEKAKIVHGDISKFNIMILNNEAVLIDIGQAVSIKHPMALELLERDLRNINKIAEDYNIKFNYKERLKSIVDKYGG